MILRTQRSSLLVLAALLFACRSGSADTATPEPKPTTDGTVTAVAATPADFAAVLAMPQRLRERPTWC